MGDLFGGGGSTTKVEIPSWLQEPMQRGIARAEQVARMGYQPYYGPEVAAFSPMQEQAMQSQYDAAAAFGMAPMGGDAMAGMPAPTEFAGGIRGYGSGDIFEQSVNEFQKRQPEQAAIYNQQFVGPDVGNQDFYPPYPPGPPYSGFPGGYGVGPLTGGYGNANPNTSQGYSGYTPYGGPNQFTDYSNPYSTFNPFSGQDIPVTAGGGPINPVPFTPSGGSAPVDRDVPFVPGQFPNGYPTTPSNPGGIPVNNDLSMYRAGLFGMMGA